MECNPSRIHFFWMRTPDEQDEWLERGRFAEGRREVAETCSRPARIVEQVREALNSLVMWSFILFGMGFVCAAATVVFKIGRDDGGPFFLLGAVLCAFLGVGFLIAAGVRSLLKRRT